MYKPKEAKLFGAALKQLLREKNLSDRQFAKQAGLEQSYVSKLLNPQPGKEIAEPRKKTRQKIAKGLGITEQELLAQIARYSNEAAEEITSNILGLDKREGKSAKLHQESGAAIDALASELSPEQAVLDQSQPSYPLPDTTKNTLEESHTIGAISFLEYFSKAIEQLKSKDFDVRIGAISTLGTIAKYSLPAEHWTIMEYLGAFIRTNAPRKEEEEGEEMRSPKLPEDIQAALTVIGQRDSTKDPPNQTLNLSNTDIRKAELPRAKFQKVRLFGAKLQGVNLCEATLEEADLSRTNMEGAKLCKANLTRANLHGANLQEANFSEANLTETIIRDAIVRHTTFHKANLQRADLRFAKLQEAYLDKADLLEADLSSGFLQGTYLNKANLQGANLIRTILDGANLQEADLSQANLQWARLFSTDLRGANNLKQQQIEQAFGDSTTVLPENLARPAHWI